MVSTKFELALLECDPSAAAKDKADYCGEGRWKVKGIKQPIEVFKVLGVKNVESAADVEFVGRDEEQSQMMDAWNMVALSSGQAVVLTGDAGAGKSALTMHVIGEIAKGDAKPLVMLCLSANHRKDTPMYTVAQMLKRWSASNLGERAQVRRILKDAGLEDEAEAHSSPLLSLLGVQNEETAKVKQEDVRATLIALLVALSGSRPVVIVVEDGEHIDAPSLGVLDELVQSKLHECKILVLVGVCAKGIEKDSPMAGWVTEPEHDNGHHIHIGPFSRDGSASIIGHLAEGKAVPAAVLDFVYKRAEGNPLYTAELFGQVVRLLKLSADKSAYEVEGDLESLPLPTSLHDAIRARMDALAKADPALGLLLELMVVLGGTCDMSQLAPVWELACTELEGDGSALLRVTMANGMKKQVLTSMTSSGFLSADRRRSSTGESSFAFKHLKLHEVLKDAMLKARARVLHGMAAEALAEVLDDLDSARHYDLGGQLFEAAKLYAKAGSTIYTPGDPPEALIAHITRFLEICKTVPNSIEIIKMTCGLLQTLSLSAMSSASGTIHSTTTAKIVEMVRSETTALLDDNDGLLDEDYDVKLLVLGLGVKLTSNDMLMSNFDAPNFKQLVKASREAVMSQLTLITPDSDLAAFVRVSFVIPPYTISTFLAETREEYEEISGGPESRFLNFFLDKYDFGKTTCGAVLVSVLVSALANPSSRHTSPTVSSRWRRHVVIWKCWIVCLQFARSHR